MLQASLEPASRAEDFGADGVVLETPLGELLAHEGTRAVLLERAPMLAGGPMAAMIGGMTLLQIASMMVGLLPRPVLAGLAQLLTEAAEPSPTR